MLKKFLLTLLALSLLLCLCACGEESEESKEPTRVVHCDHCGEAVEIDADSNMTEDWIIYCGPCNVELFGEDGLIP